MKPFWMLACLLLTGCPQATNDVVNLECDGTAERPCETACGPGKQVCTNHYWGLCVASDADGGVCSSSEDLCQEGAKRECGGTLGTCKPGVRTCVNGTWGECSGVEPASDACDGLDNDCNGTIDQGCDCKDNSLLDCGTSVGMCKKGAQRCDNGHWGNCEHTVDPEPEACDGKDNDCDGDIDEGCDCLDDSEQECGTALGACKLGTQRCVGGRWSHCENAVGPEPEACDGKDNDCDGDVDEGCDCRDGAMRECGSTLGACKLGAQSCIDGRWASCEGDIEPQPEICDAIDNDCDGDIDEGCDCRLGAMRWCPGGEGVCRSGRQVCQDGGFWGPCIPLQAATDELCDGIDNDCDGVVDDGFDRDEPCPLGGCPQRRVCTSDGQSTVCVDDPKRFSPERCDGIDNDCNGLLDRVVESGSVRSICACETRTLGIGSAVDASVENGVNLCAPTQCGPDKPKGLLVDGICYPACLTHSDQDGDGWGFENGATCLVESSPKGSAAPLCNGLPIGMAMTYCLACTAETSLPYAMCQSLPQFDLTAFGRGEKWLNVDFTFSSASAARVPINLWFHAGGKARKRLPLVKVGDVPGRQQVLLRAEDACFTPSTDLGSECPGSGDDCGQCGAGEVCGALANCGQYDLRQAWLQVAAEFCEPGIGKQAGTMTVHSVDLVEPNCGAAP